MNPGDPGLETWPSLDAARHGGAQPWLPGAYDPDTKLYIFGTGNPTPAYTAGRGEGDNLYTGSLVAVNVDTGKMAWHYQTAPHDMHDWDSAQTPVLADALFKGRMRKLVMTAARNGYFFVLDRTTGEHLLTSKYGSATNWVKELDAKGRPMRDPVKDASIGGALVSPTAGGTINWEPPAFNPETGLFYVPERNGYQVFYLIDTDPRGSMGLGGIESAFVGNFGTFLTAIDYKTGKAAWRHRYPGFGGGGGGRRRAHDRREARVRRRRQRQHRRPRRPDREAAVALAHRQRDEPAADLHARRPSVPARRRGGHVVRVRVVLTGVKPIVASGFSRTLGLKPLRDGKREAGSGKLEAGSWQLPAD